MWRGRGVYTEGALDGGSPCRLSILRNVNVARLCRLSMPISHVECMLDISLSHITVFLKAMSHLNRLYMYVEFNNRPCHSPFLTPLAVE